MSRFLMISLCDRCNLGARILVAQAKTMGHEASLLNYGQYEHDTYQFSDGVHSPHAAQSEARLRQVILRINPDVIGVSYRSIMAPLARHLAQHIRAISDAPIIAGGIGATSDVAQAQTWADSVCVGEADRIIDVLLTMPECKGYQGDLLEDLDNAPFPDYEAETTWSIVRGTVTHPDGRLDNDIGAYPLLTSRGCPRACTYCHNSTVHELYRGQTYARQRSVQNVMAELAWARERFGFKLLSIYDDLFIADPGWITEFCRELPKVWPSKRRFWCMTHPRYINHDVIGALVGAGMEEVCLGVQSGSDRILKLYKRGTTREDILRACEVLAAYPVAVKIDIISANPLENPGDELATMQLLEDMPRRPNWHPGLSRLTIFPGSKIAEQVTQAECDALHNERQDFIDGLYRGAFVERWWGLDLTHAMRRYGDFVAFKDSREWPSDDKGPLADEHWTALTTWLDEGAPS